MKNIKISVIMLAMLSMIFSVKAYAKTSNEGRNVGFVREYIKGNAYKQIVKGNKNVTNKSLNVTVTTMYKDDGSSSDYKYSIWRVVNISDVVLISNKTKVAQGIYTTIPLSRVTSTKKKLAINVKGNTSNLDAEITGTIYQFNK